MTREFALFIFAGATIGGLLGVAMGALYAEVLGVWLGATSGTAAGAWLGLWIIAAVADSE